MLKAAGGNLGKVVECTSYPEAYQDLALGRTDYVVNTIINLKALVAEKPAVFEIGQPVSGTSFPAWVLKKGNVELQAYMNEFIAKEKASGKFAELQQSRDDEVVADTCGWHDTSAGCCSCESNAVSFGEVTKYQHACRENLLLEFAKHGMSKRDIVANVNFFMNVPIERSGNFTVVDGISAPGSFVDLLADMDVLCVLSNCPQINSPCNGFNPTPGRVLIWDA